MPNVVITARPTDQLETLGADRIVELALVRPSA